MDKFPEPLALPKEVPEAREARYKTLIKAALIGISIRLVIVTVEMGGAIGFNSASLFMGALSTMLDILSSVLLIFSFKLAVKPPDVNHPFGHGRLEPLAGLQMGVFYIVLGIGMLGYNLLGMNHPLHDNLGHQPVWIIPLVSIGLLEASYRAILRSAKKHQSPALAAEAIHYRIDSVAGMLAFFALFCANFVPSLSQIFDHLGGGAIAIFMIIMGGIASKDNLHQIMDRIPDAAYIERIKRAAMRAQGVLGIEKVRARLSGPDAHVDIDVEVEPSMPVKDAHLIAQQVRVEIQKEIPLVQDVIVHIEPYYPNDH